MKTAFIITSALNTKFGVYSSDERVAQTVDTCNSVRARVPDAKIIAIEMAGIPPSAAQREVMQTHTDLYLDYSADSDVQEIFHSTDNWDIVKNTTEVMVFAAALEKLVHNNEFTGIDRIFKLSGRYTLSDNFTLDTFDHPEQFIVGQARQSQFGPNITGGISLQYMSRLWSWPANKTSNVIDLYHRGFIYMAETLAAGGYCDIEHMLYNFLPRAQVTEVPVLGVQGNIAPNGHPVVD